METKKQIPINFSAKQKSKITNHLTATHNGEPIKMCQIYLPTKMFRPADIDFGTDSHGIDRNERRAYINMPNNMIFNDKKNEERLYTYLDPSRVYKIHFNGEPIGTPDLDGKMQYDKPDVLEVNAMDIAHIFSGNKVLSKTKDNPKEENKEITAKQEISK